MAFNSEWCEWRQTAYSRGNVVEQPPLHIGPEETIVGVTTYTYFDGRLTSIEMRLSSGRQQFWGNTKTEGRTKMKTTTTKRPLAYLSGRKTDRTYINYYQLTFHWEDSAPYS